MCYPIHRGDSRGLVGIVLNHGDVFGKYRILSLLGRGGAGSVYVAEDETLGREVALKVLDRLLTRTGDFEAALRREARVVASIEHPHIVRIHALERIGDELVIDMAFLRGGSLAMALHEGRVSPLRAVTTVQEILSALACCHASGVIHRDVKPANILLDEHGIAQLSDFGLAKLMSERHTEAMTTSVSTEFFVGTPRYAPPEAWDGEEPTPSWDVYSVGMVLYEALMGRTAYEARAPLSYVKQFVERPVPRIDPGEAGISPELSEVVAAMLERDPKERPRSAAEAYERLRAVPECADLDDAPTLTPHVSSSVSLRTRRKRARRKMPPRRVVMGVVVGTMLLVLVVILSGIVDTPWLGQTRDVNAGVYDLLTVGAPGAPRGRLLEVPGAEEGAVCVVKASDTGIYLLQGTKVDDTTKSYEGYWAEYVDKSARMFRYGSVKGEGRLETGGAEVMSLEFISRQDGARSNRSMIKTPASDLGTDAFMKELLFDDFAQPLVYGELVPRRLDWAKQLEQACFLTAEGLVTVPYVEVADATVDGALDEPMWKGVQHGVAGHVVSPGHPGARMYLRYDHDALYVGLLLNRGTSGVRVSLGILNQFSVPFSQSPRWWAHFEDGQLVQASHIHANVEESWTCGWEAAVGAEVGDGWRMEIRVPFAGIGEPAMPEEGRRWRLACSVEDTVTQRVAARWGGDDNKLETGALIAFGASQTP